MNGADMETRRNAAALEIKTEAQESAVRLFTTEIQTWKNVITAIECDARARGPPTSTSDAVKALKNRLDEACQAGVDRTLLAVKEIEKVNLKSALLRGRSRPHGGHNNENRRLPV